MVAVERGYEHARRIADAVVTSVPGSGGDGEYETTMAAGGCLNAIVDGLTLASFVSLALLFGGHGGWAAVLSMLSSALLGALVGGSWARSLPTASAVNAARWRCHTLLSEKHNFPRRSKDGSRSDLEGSRSALW